MDLEGGSFAIPVKELLGDLEKEIIGDPEENFLLKLIQSTIRELDLEKLHKKF